jgi:hypothetical protein
MRSAWGGRRTQATTKQYDEKPSETAKDNFTNDETRQEDHKRQIKENSLYEKEGEWRTLVTEKRKIFRRESS